jgi:hypothetical protein
VVPSTAATAARTGVGRKTEYLRVTKTPHTGKNKATTWRLAPPPAAGEIKSLWNRRIKTGLRYALPRSESKLKEGKLRLRTTRRSPGARETQHEAATVHVPSPRLNTVLE